MAILCTHKREHTKHDISVIKRLNVFLGLLGVLLLLFACALIALLFSLRVEGLWGWYQAVQNRLLDLETYIRSIEPHYLFVSVLLLAFALRSYVPLISVSALCLMSGVVLPVYVAIPLNVLGVGILQSVQYRKGKRKGGGRAWMFFAKNVPVRKLLERDGTANPWLLYAFRLIPSFPQGAVSRVYGAMHYPYRHYILISLTGFAPKLLSYTFIGQNVFDPLSASFLTPAIIILILSGLSLLFVNTIWSFVDKNVRLSVGDKLLLRHKRKQRFHTWRQRWIPW